MKRKTKEEWISQASEKFGDSFDYSKIEYVNNYTPVTIKCKNCGYEFEVIPYVHLRQGHHCPMCSDIRSTCHMMTMEHFLTKAHELHGDKYDYSKVDLEHRDENGCVTIICPIHGEIKQKPSVHIRCGCKKCHMDKLADAKRFTTEKFIERAKSIHGDLYDYSETKYTNKRTKVKIKCTECGAVFYQLPDVHTTHGCGCPVCKFSRIEQEIKQLLENNHIHFIWQCRKDILPWLNKQSLDFYLPDYNVAIECQGSFHFNRNDYYGGEDGLKNCIERDERKYNLCKENGVRILYYANKRMPETYYDRIYSTTEEILKEIMLLNNR